MYSELIVFIFLMLFLSCLFTYVFFYENKRFYKQFDEKICDEENQNEENQDNQDNQNDYQEFMEEVNRYTN